MRCCIGSFFPRLHWNAVVLHILIMCSAVGQFNTHFRSPRISARWTHRHRNPDDQLYGIVVCADAWLAVPDSQPSVWRWFQSDLHGLVAGHRRLLSEGSQVPCPSNQHSSLRISNRFVVCPRYLIRITFRSQLKKIRNKCRFSDGNGLLQTV